MTRITGLEEFLVDLSDLSTDMQLKFAASAAVVEIPFSAKQGQKLLSEIVLQGSRAEAVAALLTADHGVPKQCAPALVCDERFCAGFCGL